ncbi:hypothetical protein SLG_29330 [Sphingobium sp. SYK-6]|uniref:hypothetical protein n=1 Tax=Sphingobium sp. (strain NBRC 103272 / SYK-6) TaxID=627192 RepID=UPI0002277279|nr:hypothetical protein [Sphingobium sp. SYK-6]BAK67608.1 hypothetical protein SLG_29330 [Sphingobium sp. SYK-6]
MQRTARRLFTVGVIAFLGAVGGVMLGNFVAGGAASRGQDELADYSRMLETMTAEPKSLTAAADRSFAPRPGPTSYECEGCDASLYDSAAAQVVDLMVPVMPHYAPEEPPVPVRLPPARTGERAGERARASGAAARPVVAPMPSGSLAPMPVTAPVRAERPARPELPERPELPARDAQIDGPPPSDELP